MFHIKVQEFIAESNTSAERIIKHMRKFETGATRDNDESKPNFVGFLSPEVLAAYGNYMLRHQKQADGQMRAADNWKKGIPRQAYMESMLRHMFEVWQLHLDQESREVISMQPDTEAMDEALFALLFNVMGFAYEREMGR